MIVLTTTTFATSCWHTSVCAHRAPYSLGWFTPYRDLVCVEKLGVVSYRMATSLARRDRSCMVVLRIRCQGNAMIHPGDDHAKCEIAELARIAVGSRSLCAPPVAFPRSSGATGQRPRCLSSLQCEFSGYLMLVPKWSCIPCSVSRVRSDVTFHEGAVFFGHAL